MGRPPTRSPIPFEVLENLNAYMLGNVQACDGMPHDADVRALIIVALTDRLKALNPTVHQHCMRAIATIANLEVARFVPRERIDSEIGIELQRIMNGKVSRVTHLRENLRQQRGALLDYFAQERYPHQSRHVVTRKAWIASHWHRMMEFLSCMHCTCGRYSTSHEDLSGTFRTLADAADSILAHLHCTTIQNVRNLLKRST